MRCRPLALAALCGSVVTACGDGTHESSPRQIVLTAGHRTESQSFGMESTLQQSFSGSGPISTQMGVFGQGLTVNMVLEEERSGRSTATFTTVSAGTRHSSKATLYDGTAYVSIDDGATYRVDPGGSLPQRYGPESALQYLQAIVSVSDLGNGTAGGVAVERYLTQVDPTKVSEEVRAAIASGAPSFSRLGNAMQFTYGSLDVAVDRRGRLIEEGGTFNLSLDMGAVDARLQGSTLQDHMTLDARFHDFGAQIVVTKPTNVSGTLQV